MKTLKQIFLTLSLICISLCVFAQRFVNPIYYNEALDFYLEALNKEKEAEKIWLDFVTDILKGDFTPQVKTVLEELETDKKDTLATKIEAIEKEIDSIKKLL